ncbi:putative duf408 domain protein [Neofusicoccum parvum UCRNP2]|uniref:RNA polymerase II subunit B1 CTD phosphatase RPAP2 homolog n=2 Tax=Neofusicoccum parvum TaxID=310453 RepID=R1GCS9_BOTPV|nr:putative duf408 domain protein [Neofusicoccum parvum UCRNP2]GME42707.1 putative RNA polymerase II subunit B1 CTD phosphatase rpap2 [Neofusicoccum parvum]
MAPPRFDGSALPKSILKKIHAPAQDRPPPAARAPPRPPSQAAQQQEPQAARDRRNREIALYHAHLIQQQKEVEAQILDAIVQLIDFPSAPDADPMRPSHDDASMFKALIANFQPSDYDSLLEERKCADRCGYALCPRPPKVDANAGKNKFVVKGRQLQVVPREKLELWCSDDCARRALFVKVQLNEEPAWLRRAGVAPQLDLMADAPGGDRAPDLNAVMSGLSLDLAGPSAWARSVDEARNLDRAMADLALERGEQGRSTKAAGLVKDNIHENSHISPPNNPESADHFSIEGYQPRMNGRNGVERDEDGDWIL